MSPFEYLSQVPVVVTNNKARTHVISDKSEYKEPKEEVIFGRTSFSFNTKKIMVSCKRWKK